MTSTSLRTAIASRAIGLIALSVVTASAAWSEEGLLRGPLDMEQKRIDEKQLAVAEEANAPVAVEGQTTPEEDAGQAQNDEAPEESAETRSTPAEQSENEVAESEAPEPSEAVEETVEVAEPEEVVEPVQVENAPTDEAVAKGREVADAASANDSGWIDSVAELKMILKNSRGRESRREMVVKLLEGGAPESDEPDEESAEAEGDAGDINEAALDAAEAAVAELAETDAGGEADDDNSKKDKDKDEKDSDAKSEGDRSLVIFMDPADITGTALLSFNNVERADDQWLYLPAVKKTRRIAASKRNGSFVASEFTYEDMVPSDVEEFTYRYIGEETCGEELTCHRVERVPVDKDAGYKRQEVWWDTEEYRPYKIEYFNKRDELEKTLNSTDFRLYKEKFWRPHYQEMKNHQTGKSTELYLNNIEFETGLGKRDFNAQRLDKIR